MDEPDENRQQKLLIGMGEKMIKTIRRVWRRSNAQDFRLRPAVVLLFLAVSALLGMAACSGPKTMTKLPETSSQKQLLILPFKNMTAVYGEDVNVRSPLSGFFFVTGPVEPEADRFMTDRLTSLVRKCTTYQVIPAKQVQAAMAGMVSDERDLAPDRRVLIETGQRLAADFILAGYLYRFRQRVGNQLGVEKPASVAFDIVMINVPDGRIAWSGHLDEQQEPLTDDLFKLGKFIKRKGKWITADEMAVSGMEEMLQSCPKP
jgi:hypothetical protein